MVGLLDGIINYSILLILFLIFYNFLRAYKKSQKAVLFRSIVSLVSISLCVFFLFTIENVFKFHDVLSSYGLSLPSVIILLAFSLCYIVGYLLIGRILKYILNLINVLHFFKEHSLLHRRLNFVLISIRKTIIVVFVLTLVSVIYPPLYTSGISKPVVDLDIIKSTQTELMRDLEYLETESQNVDAFLSLYSSDDMKETIKETNDILDEINNYETVFMNYIFKDLTNEQKERIDDAYFEAYGTNRVEDHSGILAVLVNDDLYQSILKDQKGFKHYIEFAANIKVINRLLFEEEQIYSIQCKTFIKENSELIQWTIEERTTIEELKTVKDKEKEKILVESLIRSFSDHETDLKKTKFNRNKDRIERISDEINNYYLMQEWTINKIVDQNLRIDTDSEENYVIYDHLIYEALKKPDVLDAIIVQYNEDYKTSRFDKLPDHYKLKKAYRYSNDYLTKYQTYSEKIDVEIDPAIRLKAAILHEEITIENYLYNQVSLELLLKDVQPDNHCKFISIDYQSYSSSVCKQENTFETIDIFMWGYLIDIDTQQYRVSSDKVAKLYDKIDVMDPDKKRIIEKEMKQLTDQLLFTSKDDQSKSYIESYYKQNVIGYDVMKILYKEEMYSSTIFHEKIEDVIK